MSRLTFSQAAKEAGIHPNTLRNWNKAGKLRTARKVIENGVQVWTVELPEVFQVIGAAGLTNATNVDVSPDIPPANTAVDNRSMELVRLLEQRETALQQLQAARLEDSTAIGKLSGKVEELERQITRLEARERSSGRLVAWLLAALVLVAVLAMVLIFIAR